MKETFFRFMELLGFVPEREAVNEIRYAREEERAKREPLSVEVIAIELVKHDRMIYKACKCGEQLHESVPLQDRLLWHADHQARKVAELWNI